MSILSLPSQSKDVNETSRSDDPHTLARLYGALVFKAAYRVLGERALAEDVQQDVFLRLLESAPQTVASWPAFLAAAAVRRAIDVLRRQQRWWRLSALWRSTQPSEDCAEQNPEQISIERERGQLLRKALAQLPVREAQCFGLRYLQGFDIPEIASALALSENNVNVTLHRARKRLEASVGNSYSGDHS
jgi:RNA polymerase sigma factor (sigma-70 family)